MICIKLHKSYRNILAVCDSDLIGKKFEEGNKQLNCRESFYKQEEISYEEAVRLMKFQRAEDVTFNIVGKNSVEAAEEAGIINSDCIGKVQNIPFILILL